MQLSSNFTIQRIRSKLKPKYQWTWIFARNVAGHKYGNEIRDTACPAGLGNGKIGQSKKGYSLT